MEKVIFGNISLKAPRSEANWNIMPSEILAKIVGYLDFPESLHLKKCGHREADIVNRFAKTLDIKIKIIFNVAYDGSTPVIDIFVNDKLDAELFWLGITEHGGKTKIDSSLDLNIFEEETQDEKTSPELLSSILKWFLTEKLFNVVLIETSLEAYQQFLELLIPSNEECNIPRSISDGCKSVISIPPVSIVTDQNVIFGASVWLTKADFITVMNARNVIYTEIEEHSIFDTFKWNWVLLMVIVDPHHRTTGSFAMAFRFVESLTRIYPEMEHVFMRNRVMKKVDSTKGINTIMYFIRAYRNEGSSMTVYLNDEPGFEQKIAFLRQGLHDSFHLDSFQLTVLIFVFRLRLVLNEPEVPQVYEKVCDGFKLVLKEYQENNYYETIMKKVETLVENI